MSDLRQRLLAAAASPVSELDAEALVSRTTRRRRRRAVAVTTAAAVVVLAAGGGVLAARRGPDGGSVRTRGGSESTLAPSTSSTTSTPVGTAPPRPPAGGTGGTWGATPTTGLRNFDDVTITATGVPAGSYDVGQCPAASARAGDLSRCLLNAVVDVTDGHLTAKVRAFWWMSSGQIDCGAAAGTCLVGVRDASPKSTFVPVTFDLGFDPAKRPTIEVTPSTGLVDGQGVEVHGINVGAGSVTFSECLRDQWASCTYATATAGADGNFTATLPVQRVLHWGFHGLIDQSSECGVDGDCVVVVWVAPNGFENFDSSIYRVWIEPTRPVVLGFAPAPPPTTTTTTSTTSTTPPG
jgi:Neocarzinostatin family